MIVAVASGKGGTGKTTVSVALATSAAGRVEFVDCDVEEPNGSIFLKPEVVSSEKVCVSVPVIDEKRCISCGDCASFCRFNALVSLGSPPIVFPELCHSCGGCEIVCTTEAVSWREIELGQLSRGVTDNGISVIQGQLSVGNVLAPPVIRAAKEAACQGDLTIIDCPPGTSCPVIEAVAGADYVLLVTEPTPFGLHDLKLAVETARELELPFSVVINRFDYGDTSVEEFCRTENIHIILRIPHRRLIAEVLSRGGTILDVMPEMLDEFCCIPEVIIERLK